MVTTHVSILNKFDEPVQSTKSCAPHKPVQGIIKSDKLRTKSSGRVASLIPGALKAKGKSGSRFEPQSAEAHIPVNIRDTSKEERWLTKSLELCQGQIGDVLR